MTRPTGDDGATALELALLVPALSLLVAAMLQVALWMHASHVALAAARQGARAAAVEHGTAAQGRATARDYVTTLGPNILSRVDVRATRTATTARVEVRARAVSLIPGINLSVSEVAQKPTERFRAGP